MADPARIIAQNLADLRGRITDTAAGRAVRLVCVTKYARDEWVRALLAAGASDLGENLLPGAHDRFERWRQDYPSFTRHLLGAQQSRKVKLIPDCCELFQALDRMEVAEKLQQFLMESGRRLDVLLEVNIDAEPQKHGFPTDQLGEALESLVSHANRLVLKGLICIPQPQQASESPVAFERRTRTAYSTMAQLFDKLKPTLPAGARWDTLSMGMSQDFTWAIAEGATMVRIGSALFAGLEG